MAHGGKRARAGRKRTALARSANLKRVEAEAILASIDELEYWQALLSATVTTSVAVIGGESGQREQITIPDNRIRLETVKYLTDRRDGKPRQAIEHSGEGGGPVEHTIRFGDGKRDSH